MAETQCAVDFRPRPLDATQLRVVGSALELAQRATLGLDERIDLLPVPDQEPRVTPPAVKRVKDAKARNRLDREVVTNATRELFDRLGPAERVDVTGSVMYRWNADAEGDTVLIARMSSAEHRKGETIGLQLDTVMRYADDRDLRVRRVVAMLDATGAARYQDRTDFAEILELVRAGTVKRVVYRHIDRLSRSVPALTRLVEDLLRYGVELHVAALGRPLDLNPGMDRFQLWTLAAAAELEHHQITERTSGANRRRLEDGQLWSSSGGFGFARDADGRIVDVPEEFVAVHQVHHLYLQPASSYRKVADAMKQFGWDFTEERVRFVLSDERYVTGTFRTKSGEGERVDVVELSNPVPAIVREQCRLKADANTGAKTSVPRDRILLNRTPLFHARCMGSTTDDGKPIRLTGRRDRLGKLVYRHEPRTPQCCRGFTIPVDVLDAAVVRAVRQYLTSPELQLEALARARGHEPEGPRGLMSPPQRRRVRAGIGSMQREVQGLRSRLLQATKQGTAAAVRAQINAEIALIEAEIAAETRSLELDDAIRRVTPMPAVGLPEALDRVLTEKAPDDEADRIKRAAIVRSLVGRVIVRDDGDQLAIQIDGPDLPPDAPVDTWKPAVIAADAAMDAPAGRTGAASNGTRGNGPIPSRPDTGSFPAYRLRPFLVRLMRTGR